MDAFFNVYLYVLFDSYVSVGANFHHCHRRNVSSSSLRNFSLERERERGPKGGMRKLITLSPKQGFFDFFFIKVGHDMCLMLNGRVIQRVRVGGFTKKISMG